MSTIFTIARKEIKDILSSRIFMAVLILLFILTAISLFVSELVFQDQVLQYNTSLELLKSLWKSPTTEMPQFYPLNLLRWVVDYIEIIGAILGIFLGYITVFKEKNTKAIKLLLTRPISKQDIIYGKIFGNFIFILGTVFLVSLLIFFTLPLVGGVWLNVTEIVKLGIFTLISSFYILIFFTLSLWLSLYNKNIVNALILAFSVWLLFVLIFPQIGDTMDPDNQVPGGFFKSMALNHDQGLKVMDNFKNYEMIRTGVEQISVTKHYERSLFALFGIKHSFNDQTLMQVLMAQWGNMLSVFIFFLIWVCANIQLFRKNEVLLE